MNNFTCFEEFGKFAKELRLKTGFTLRRFCIEYNYDPGNYSKIERGLSAPPSSEEKQEKFAENLGLLRDSEDWIKFFDLAAICKGKIPSSIMSEDKIVAKLPFIFKVLRGDELGEIDKKLMDLVQLIKGG